MIKRIVAVMSALALAVGLLPTVLADEVTSTKPEITVVAKRITGEDNYMEISLEVNGDYEDYSSVGAVLQYDPSLIVPTTWDDEAASRFGVHHQIAIFLKGPYGQAFHIDPSHLYRSLLSSKPPA